MFVFAVISSCVDCTVEFLKGNFVISFSSHFALSSVISLAFFISIIFVFVVSVIVIAIIRVVAVSHVVVFVAVICVVACFVVHVKFRIPLIILSELLCKYLVVKASCVSTFLQRERWR